MLNMNPDLFFILNYSIGDFIRQEFMPYNTVFRKGVQSFCVTIEPQPAPTDIVWLTYDHAKPG